MSWLISERSATSLIIFLVFIFIAFTNTTSILAKNHKRTEGAVIAKPDEICKDGVESFEHARNIWNSNQNETTSNVMEYLASDTMKPYKLLKSTTSGTQHELMNKHGTMSRRRKHRRNRKSKQDSDVMSKMTKNKVKPHETQNVSESIPKSKSFQNATEDAKQPCTTCGLNALEDEETVKNIRIQMFVKTLADKLRITPEELKSRFGSKPRYKLPDEILEEALHDSPDGQEIDNYYARNERKIVSGRDMGRNCISRGTSGCYRFDIEEDMSSTVISGQLWVYKTPDRHDSQVQSFFVYSLEKLKNGSVRVESLIHRHETNVRKGWVIIPIYSRRLPVNKNTEVMLAIQCATCAKRSHKALFGAKHKYAPLLVLETGRHHFETRRKRDTESTDCDPSITCCKKKLEVNLYELGLHFTPRIINVYHCHGNCAIPQATYNHTMVKQKLKNSLGHTYLTICCAPIEFRPAFLFLEGEVSRQVYYPNLIVNRCGCI